MSLSYAASLAAQAVAAAALFFATLEGWTFVQVSLLFTYGIRLGSYLVIRNLNRGFRAREARLLAKRGRIGALTKFIIWISVAALYVLLALPVLLTLSAEAAGLPLGSLPLGITLMAIGLGFESVADWQKYRFKVAQPTRFCNSGLYRIVRCPNYLGEMLFWIGVWFSAATAYHGWLEWSLCTVGLACILGIMIGATRRLEGEQAEHYAADDAYAIYTRTVPVLFPFLPIYSLRHMSARTP